MYNLMLIQVFVKAVMQTKKERLFFYLFWKYSELRF